MTEKSQEIKGSVTKCHENAQYVHTVGIHKPYSSSLNNLKVKVKCTPVQALRLCTGRRTHRGSRGIALPFHDHGTRRG
jgi:hypothetical protein